MNYLVFTWDRYYPHGGFNDLDERFEHLPEAQGYLRAKCDDSTTSGHIVDASTLRVVCTALGCGKLSTD